MAFTNVASAISASSSATIQATTSSVSSGSVGVSAQPSSARVSGASSSVKVMRFLGRFILGVAMPIHVQL